MKTAVYKASASEDTITMTAANNVSLPPALVTLVSDDRGTMTDVFHRVSLEETDG